jgi:hypothetical protein
VRLIKMLGLAAVAALAAMAFVGASTASADTLCEVNTNPCPEANRVAAGKLIAGLATNQSAKLLNQNKEALLTCNSETLGKVTATGGGKPVLGEISKLLFTNCVGSCTKAHGFNLNYKVEAIAAAGHALVSKGTGAGKPGATVEGCPFGVTCKFEITNASALLKVSGDTLTASEVPLTLLNPGLCSILASAGFWDATYLTTLDVGGKHETPLFLVASP